MKAVIHKTKQEIQVVQDPKQVAAAECGELFVGKKPVLIVKNGNTEQIASIIYLRFNRETDSAGNPFVFSRKYRGLAHTDPVWGSRSKVTGPQFEQYLSDWFVFAEKVTNVNGDALILTDKLPKFFSALMNQSRYTQRHFELFELVD